jgi:nucleoside-diphosphate-sugar epimerase
MIQEGADIWHEAEPIETTLPPGLVERGHAGDKMKVFLIGATGLIGSAIASRLSAGRHKIIGVARHPNGSNRSIARWISLHISRADTGDWAAILAGADALVNCAGIL